MKTIMLGFLFLVAGCLPSQQNEIKTKLGSDLLRYEDSETNVVCYRVLGFEGISCIQLQKTFEELMKE